MTALLEQQLIDNENRIAMMAAIITTGLLVPTDPPDQPREFQNIAALAVKLARAIQREVGQ